MRKDRETTEHDTPWVSFDMSSWETAVPDVVEIIEVGPRDGFQNLPDFIETELKIRIIESLIQAGIQRMEVTSFVHPRAVPQMRDADEVLKRVGHGGCECFAMVPNLIGAERAIEAGAGMLNLVVSASESHNQSNVRRSIDDSLRSFEAVVNLAERNGVPVRASIATAFGCPFDGPVPIDKVLCVAGELVDMGCVELNLCDTTGMANPSQVARLTRRILSNFSDTQISMHFHNTRGAGMANLLSAMETGVTSFETAFGGLGGCPFAPGAAGNVCTEDAVHMLHEMGVSTGVDLPCLLDAVREAERALNVTFPGQVIKAGRSCDLHPLPDGA